MRRAITSQYPDGEFWQLLAGYQRTAWRWENQPVYAVTDEQSSVAAYLAGQPENPMDSPYLGPWMHQVAEQVRGGKKIGRVRVLEEPATDYQNWELWLDPWNTRAGEQIGYLTRSQAQALGPAPFGDADWWLFDEQRVVIMHYDDAGHWIKVELSEDPEEVAAARLFAYQAVGLAAILGLRDAPRAA